MPVKQVPGLPEDFIFVTRASSNEHRSNLFVGIWDKLDESSFVFAKPNPHTISYQVTWRLAVGCQYAVSEDVYWYQGA
jgi:hypothetical protein